MPDPCHIHEGERGAKKPAAGWRTTLLLSKLQPRCVLVYPAL